MHLRLLRIALVLAVAAPLAHAVVVDLTPIRDTTLYETADGSLANGAGEHIFVGKTAGGAARRALIAFDLSSLPADAVVQSVRLRLHMSRTLGQSQNVMLHRLLADWGEGTSHAPGQEGGGAASETGDASWIHTFFDTALWSAPGGDFLAAASGVQLVGLEGFYTWDSTPEMVADVQLWIDDPASNHGWLVMGREGFFDPTAKRFDSRQHSDPAQRPLLTVDFTTGTVPEIPTLSPAGWMLLALLLAAAGAASVRRRGKIPPTPLS